MIRWDLPWTAPPRSSYETRWSMPLGSVSPSLLAVLLGISPRRARLRVRVWMVRRFVEGAGWWALRRLGRA